MLGKILYLDALPNDFVRFHPLKSGQCVWGQHLATVLCPALTVSLFQPEPLTDQTLGRICYKKGATEDFEQSLRTSLRIFDLLYI